MPSSHKDTSKRTGKHTSLERTSKRTGKHTSLERTSHRYTIRKHTIRQRTSHSRTIRQRTSLNPNPLPSLQLWGRCLRTGKKRPENLGLNVKRENASRGKRKLRDELK